MTLRQANGAGRSAREQFKRLRLKKIRERWYDWLVFVGAIAGSLAAVVFYNGWMALGFAALLGVFLTIGFFAWMMGGDVHSLTWLWGAVGEEATAEALEALDGSWTCEHDLPHEFGNWDHVVAGPSGVFLLETKNLSSRSVVRNDALVSGRLRFSGGALRRSAVRLRDALRHEFDRTPWVQAVCVVWGPFAEEPRTENRVVYLRGADLVAWLREQPARLEGAKLEAARRAVRGLRERAVPEQEQRTA